MISSPQEVFSITVGLAQLEISSRKISLERMKSRSQEYRGNCNKPVNRSGLSQSLRSLILDAADGRPCPTCGTTMQHRRGQDQIPDMATIEHILPIKEGGDNEPENLLAMCLACNRSRGYAYNQARKVTREEIDAILEWLWLHLNHQRFSKVVELRLGYMYPNPHAIFERNWRKQYDKDEFKWGYE